MSQTIFNLDDETKRQAQHKALDAGLSFAEVLRRLVTLWLAGKIVLEGTDGSSS